MRISNYTLGNFKPFGHLPQNIPLKPITLIFGPNSAGKSSCIQGIKYLVENSVANLDIFSGRSVHSQWDHHEFTSLVHQQDESKRILLGISLKPSDQVPLPEGHFTEMIQFEWTIGRGAGLALGVMDLAIATKDREMCKLSRKQNGWSFDFVDIEHPFILKSLEKHPEEKIELSELVIKLYIHGWPYAVETSDSASKATHSLSRLLNKLLVELWRYLGDSRSLLLQIPPMREVPSKDSDFRNLGQPWSLLNQSKTRNEVNQFLSQISFKSGYKIVIETFHSESFINSKQAEFEKECMEHFISNNPDVFSGEDNPLTNALSNFKIFLEEGTVDEIIGLLDSCHTPDNWNIFCEYKLLEEANPENFLDEEVMQQCISMAENYEQSTGKKWDESSHVDQINYFFDAPRSESMRVFFKWDHFFHGCLFHYMLFRKWLRNHRDFNHFLDGGIPGEIDSMVSYTSILRPESGHCNSIWKMYLEDTRFRTKHTLDEVGYGIGQLLPVIISAFGSKCRLIAIEQPEIHIHPALQAELADVFIESALGENSNTFLLETHSEHLILRILRRIRETTEQDFEDWPEALRKACPNGIRPEDVAVLYVEPGKEGAQVKNLRVNELGEIIDEWPNGFFEERIREVL